MVVKWRKLVTTKNIPIAALNAIYDQHPELIGYSIKDALAVVTSNQSGSVDLKIVNGTKCILEALYWKDSSIQQEANRKIERARRKNEIDVIVDTPPDYVLVTLLDKEGKIRSRDSFPLDLNLLPTFDDNRITIPIAMTQLEDLVISKEDKIKIKYSDHALDLGFAFTAWKVQGLIFDLIIILLDQSIG